MAYGVVSSEDVPFIVQNGEDPTDYIVKVDSAGAFTLKGTMTVTGSISGGTVSGATISGGSLSIGSNFSVSSSGVLSASGASITGAITATSGTISGTVNISGTLNVTSGKMDAGNFHLTSAGAMGVGGSTQANSPFEVASNGTVSIDVSSSATALAVSNTGNRTGKQFSWTDSAGGNIGYISKDGVMFTTGRSDTFYGTTSPSNPSAHAADTVYMGYGGLTLGGPDLPSIDFWGHIDDANRTISVDTTNFIRFGSPTTTLDTNLYRSAANRLKTDDDFHVGADFRHLGANAGFFGHGTNTQQTVTGSRSGNTALNNLVQALDSYGLIVNSTTA